MANQSGLSSAVKQEPYLLNTQNDNVSQMCESALDDFLNNSDIDGDVLNLDDLDLESPSQKEQ